MRRRTWVQLAMLLGEGLTFLASGLVTYVLLSRWGGAELLGQYSVVLAWIVLFQALGSFGLPEFVTREAGRVGHDQGKFVAHGLMIGLVASGLAMAVMVAVVGVLDYDAQTRTALLLGTLTLAPAMVDGMCRGGFLASRQVEWIFLVRLVEVLVVVPVNAYLIVTGHGVGPLVLTLAAGKAVASLVSLYWLNRHAFALRWTFDAALCRRSVAPAATFWASQVLGLVSARVSIIILSLWAPIAAVGAYAAASKVVEVMLLVPVVFSHFMLPRLADGFSRRRTTALREQDGVFRLLFSVTVPSAVGLLFFAEPVVRMLFGHRFESAVPILRLLAVYFVMESADILTSLVLKAAEHQKADVRMYSLNPACNVLLGVTLIPALGGIGAALARIASVGASLVVRYSYASRRLASLGWVRVAVTPLVVSVGLALVLSRLQGRMPDALLGLLYAAGAAGALFVAARFSAGRPGGEPGSDTEPTLAASGELKGGRG